MTVLCPSTLQFHLPICPWNYFPTMIFLNFQKLFVVLHSLFLTDIVSFSLLILSSILLISFLLSLASFDSLCVGRFIVLGLSLSVLKLSSHIWWSLGAPSYLTVRRRTNAQMYGWKVCWFMAFSIQWPDIYTLSPFHWKTSKYQYVEVFSWKLFSCARQKEI